MYLLEIDIYVKNSQHLIVMKPIRLQLAIYAMTKKYTAKNPLRTLLMLMLYITMTQTVFI